MGYKLVEKKSDRTETFIITIVADSNDADWVTEKMEFNKEEFEEILPALVDLKENFSGSHELENYTNPMELDIPYNGYDGYCHTLYELTVEYIDENGKIYDVEFWSDEADKK